MRQALEHCNIFTGEELLEDSTLLIENGHILDLVKPGGPKVEADASTDLRGDLLLPGFIDLQVNGGGGVLFNEAPSVETIRQIGAAHRRFGTTGFLPTLISTTADTMRQAITATAAAISQGTPGVLGIHLEGPYLNPQRRGIHDSSHFTPLDSAALELVSTHTGGKTLLTAAPENISAETLQQLRERDVIVCAGHSAATYAQTRAVLDAGLRGFTHLFNAMSPMQSREPGVVGAALEDDNSYCGIIVDGHHVHPATLRVALASKPPGKVFLVTDAMPCVGSDIDSFSLAGETIHLEDGRLCNVEGTLAGSALDMGSAVRNAINMLRLDWQEAVRMASTYPATLLGLQEELGSIRPGYRASLTRVNREFQVQGTWIDGEGQ